MWFAALFVASALDSPTPAPRIPDGAWSEMLTLGGHPRVIGYRDFLVTLARTKPDAYREIVQSDSLLARGIVHAVEGLPKESIALFVRLALGHVERGVTNLHQDTWIWLTEVALTYDLFHDAIEPADRARMIDWMNAHLGSFTADENAFHNSTLSKILCYLRIAYATWGENPRAREFRDEALTRLYEGKVLPVLHEFGAGGGFTECGWYTRGSLWYLVQALELARRIEGYDGFELASRFFYQRLAYEMYQPYPGLWMYGAERYPVEGDGAATYGGHNEYPRHTRTLLAQYFRGLELARYVAAKRRRGSNPEARLVDFLYEEEPDAPLDPAGLPLAHLVEGIGKVYARSDWTDDATWFRFECGDYWAGHQHYEVGNFEIFRHDPLATESGEYTDYLDNHSVNWLIRTIAHNSILVHQPDETWRDMRDGGRNAYANDGGQAKKWQWTVDNLDIWEARREEFERGDIVAYRNAPEYLYVAGDGTKAYASTKLRSWVRQIVFLRPHTFVIFDRVVATRATYAKTWLLHTRNEPTIDGTQITAEHGKGTLHVQTLLPTSPVVRKVEGYTYGGLTFDPRPSVHTPTANRWRVEVSPSADSVDDVFVHVLSTDGPVTATAARDGEDVRVTVGDSVVRFTEKVGGTLRIGSEEVPLRAEVVKGTFE